VSRHQKGKTNLDLLEQEIVSGTGISWAIWKSAPWRRHITTPTFHHLVVGCWHGHGQWKLITLPLVGQQSTVMNVFFCVSVCEHLRNHIAILTKFSLHVTSGCSSFRLLCHWYTLCTFSFGFFSRNYNWEKRASCSRYWW